MDIPAQMSPSAALPGNAPRLKRSLTLWDLILYGVIVIQPVAPMSVFGVLSDRGRGHVVTTILIAMVAMLLTAISRAAMARAYPSAGSSDDEKKHEHAGVLGCDPRCVLRFVTIAVLVVLRRLSEAREQTLVSLGGGRRGCVRNGR
jgi:hypothetical protein